MAAKNYNYSSDSGAIDNLPDLNDPADITVAFSNFVGDAESGLNKIFSAISTDVTNIDNKLDGTSVLSIPFDKFKLYGTQSANTVGFTSTNTAAITLTLPSTSTTLLGNNTTQTITNKSLGSGITILADATITNSGVISGGTYTSPTINTPTISSPTITGSVSGNQDFNNNVNIDGTLTVGQSLTAGATALSSLTVAGYPIEQGYIPLPGMIVMYNGSTAPLGWAICDGTNGTPDLRDKFVIGASANKALSTSGGSGTTDSTATNHEHSVYAAGNFGVNATGQNHAHWSYHDHSTSAAGGHSHNSNTGSQSASFSFKFASGNLNTGTIAGSHTHAFNTGTDGSHNHGINATGHSVDGAYMEHTHYGSVGVGGTAYSAGGSHTHTYTPSYYALTYIMKLP